MTHQLWLNGEYQHHFWFCEQWPWWPITTIEFFDFKRKIFQFKLKNRVELLFSFKYKMRFKIKYKLNLKQNQNKIKIKVK